MIVPIYLKNIGTAIKDVFYEMDGDSFGRRIARVGLSITYPTAIVLEQAGLMDNCEVAGMGMFYRQMFPKECILRTERITDRTDVCTTLDGDDF